MLRRLHPMGGPMRLLAAVVLCAVAAPAHAGVDPQILDAMKKVKASDYPSANTVGVIEDQAVVYQADGQFVNTQHSARLVLTTTGKQEAASASFYYTKDAEKMEIVEAQVVKPDGKVVAVD